LETYVAESFDADAILEQAQASASALLEGKISADV
jgi:hypothetical protein